jgi:hypothetical protein
MKRLRELEKRKKRLESPSSWRRDNGQRSRRDRSKLDSEDSLLALILLDRIASSLSRSADLPLKLLRISLLYGRRGSKKI